MVKRVARAVSALVCLAMLGCAADDDVVPQAPVTASRSEASASTAVPTGTTSSASEPARGLVLRHDYARLRVPEGWSRRSTFKMPFLRQASADDNFGIVTFGELQAVTPSLDALAKDLLSNALGQEGGLRRRANVAIGDGSINAVRLAGKAGPNSWEETYGVLYHGLEWTIDFDFAMINGSPAQRQEIIDSVLASFQVTV